MEHKDKDTLLNLKDSYHQIPVPDQARKAVLEGIQKGKKEKRNTIMMKITKRSALSAAAAVSIIAIMANASPVTANAMENIPVISAIAKVVTFRTFSDSQNNYEAQIDIPKVSINEKDNTGVNRSIEDYANQLIKEYETQVTQDIAGNGHYSVTSGYEVVTDNSKYLSLRINTTVIMASGAEYVKIFTIDKGTGEVVSLNHLFRGDNKILDHISDNIKSQMVEQMAADDSKVYYYNSEEPAEDFKGLKGEESYYFNEKGEIVIVFDEYEVAPGYMGVVEFTIPKSVTGY
ncbi:DUF3298 and DUF4163 domain-containing protein [Lacrimispora aerotolerans]|uniref:DUF3298 and DUF4163 domain-containing protein n=1 Tax=Lacrimispora aerotolerans TaxID=36832 RepID=UPI00047B51E0|nr:DUF3298 and DUF4163 domain-containing protein [Lacrimispora aerotolerans]